MKKPTKAERLRQAKKLTEKTLRKTGFYRSLDKYGDGYTVPFPDLSVKSNCSPTTNIIAPTPGRKELPPDAKQFPIARNHKQGFELVSRKEDLMFMNGKKH